MARHGISRGLRRVALATAVVVVAAGAGGTVGGATTEPPIASEPATEATTGTEATTVTPAAPTDSTAPDATGSASEWETVVPGGDCQCADGSEFAFHVRTADPAKVVLFLEGGGACFTAETCAFTDTEQTTYSWRTGPEDDPARMGGIFELDNPANPFGDHSMIFVPYCTGDVHIGDATTEYSPELTVQHKGAVNGAAAVAYLAEQFPDAEQVVVVGESAGAVAAPLYGGLVSDALPDAEVIVFADGAGGYPGEPGLTGFVGGLWGTMNAVPDWEVNEGMTVENWTLPGLWVQAGTHDPEIAMSRFDYAFDSVQVFFAGLAGVAADELVEFLDANEAMIEAAGVDQASFTAPGDDHTLVRRDTFYTMEVDGVSLVDWLTDLLAGADVPDVHCTECTVG